MEKKLVDQYVIIQEKPCRELKERLNVVYRHVTEIT